MLELTPDDWRELEKTYEQELGDEARGQLIEVTNRYLFSVRPERNAAKTADVKKIAEKLERKFGPFIGFAYGDDTVHLGKKASTQPKRDDAYSEFETRYEMQLKKWPVGINASKLTIQTENSESDSAGPLPPDIQEYLATNGVSLELDVTTIMEIAIKIASALGRIKSEIEKGNGSQISTGFVPGRAFETFLLELRDWAKKYGLPFAYRVSGEAGPLAKLCFWLNHKFDPKYRDNVASEDAIYDRWSAARKRRSQG